MKRKDYQFDFLNFAYGFGAAVVIAGAMFKFLGWQYADEVFIVGLTTEALVFIISGIELRPKTKVYKWERLFPQLTDEDQEGNEKIDLTESFNTYYKNTENITKSVATLNEAISNLNNVSNNLTKSVESLQNQVSNIESSSKEYEKEIAELKEKMNSVNSVYSEMLNVFGRQESSKEQQK